MGLLLGVRTVLWLAAACMGAAIAGLALSIALSAETPAMLFGIAMMVIPAAAAAIVAGALLGSAARAALKKRTRTLPQPSTDIDELRSEFERLCRRLKVRRVLHETPQDNGSAHVEIADGAFHYVVTGRGSELERRTTRDRNELLYWLLSAVVFELASASGVRHRIKDQDFRRLLFAKEVEIMGTINREWAERKSEEIRRILSAHPFEDAG